MADLAGNRCIIMDHEDYSFMLRVTNVLPLISEHEFGTGIKKGNCRARENKNNRD